MLKLRKKLLSASLAAIIAVSAASVPAWSESEDVATGDGATDDTTAADDATTETGTFVTEEEAFSKTELAYQNSKAAIYVNKEDYTFVVENKETGYKWWSSFYNTDDSNKTKVSKRSTLLSVEVVGTESKNVETARAYDKQVTKTVETIDNGIKFTFHFKKYDILVPLLITLNDDGSFNATVPAGEIVENKPETDAEGNTGYQIVSIHILENMGATDASSDGYIVVPDGSGAVINYNNGTLAGDNNTYEANVYGRDLAVGLLGATAVTETVTMPVMSTINKTGAKDNGLVLVAADGDAYAIAHAAVTGQNVTDLNACWFEFKLRTTDKYYMGSSNEPLTVFEANGIKAGDCTVTYYAMSDDDLSFVDSAKVYREYLIEKQGLTKKTEAGSAPFYLTLYGGTTKEQSILGFPVDIQTAATTYSEALEIVKKLEAQGIDNIKIIYEDFNEAGVVSNIAATFQYSSLLGGKNDYKEFSDYVASKGYELFPSCDIMEFYKSGNGYSFTLNASKQITKSYATQTEFELAFGLPHETKPSWTILSPYYFTDIFNKLSDTFKAEGSTGISLNQASYTLYSDFSRYNADGRNYFVREDTIGILKNGYQKLKNDGFTVLTENANQYVLQYADYIKDVPLYSSDFDIFDYDVPFAQTVLHGYIPLTSKSINKSADADELRLLSLVTGTPIHYEMMYENPNKFTDCEYDSYYYTYYEGWLERCGKEYKLFNEIIASVSDATITEYNRISETEFESTFSNGNKIYVNTDTYEIKYNGTSYDLADYGLGVSE